LGQQRIERLHTFLRLGTYNPCRQRRGKREEGEKGGGGKKGGGEKEILVSQPRSKPYEHPNGGAKGREGKKGKKKKKKRRPSLTPI